MSASFRIEIGQRIKEIRASMNMTQKQFCLFFGPTVRTVTMVSKIESGDSYPPIYLFCMLGNKGINLNWLFTGKGEMYVKGEGVYVPSGASRKEVRMCHQLYKILTDGTPEQIQTIEGILNAFAPEDKKLKKGAA